MWTCLICYFVFLLNPASIRICLGTQDGSVLFKINAVIVLGFKSMYVQLLVHVLVF
jgi:hypothetical protein